MKKQKVQENRSRQANADQQLQSNAVVAVAATLNQ